jgi:dephospho-CoA kinase
MISLPFRQTQQKKQLRNGTAIFPGFLSPFFPPGTLPDGVQLLGFAGFNQKLKRRSTFDNMTLKIGLTGGIGSGKTTVAKIFELLHVPVYYADAASKRLYRTDAGLRQKLKEHFGDDIYNHNELNRARLAAIVFNDAEKLALLNSLVHPPTIKDAQEWMDRQTTPYIIKEAALLFESGSSEGLDYVIGVYAPQHIRLLRTMDRDRTSRGEVLSRMNHQIDEGIKMKLCDFVVTNDEQELVIPQVMELDGKLKKLAGIAPSAVESAGI